MKGSQAKTAAAWSSSPWFINVPKQSTLKFTGMYGNSSKAWNSSYIESPRKCYYLLQEPPHLWETVGRAPNLVIVTIRDNEDYVRVLLYSYHTTISRWGVLLGETNSPLPFHSFLEYEGRNFWITRPGSCKCLC